MKQYQYRCECGFVWPGHNAGRHYSRIDGYPHAGSFTTEVTCPTCNGVGFVPKHDTTTEQAKEESE